MSYPEDKERGKRIKKARELAGLNQSQAAKALGIAQNTLSEYERGNRIVKRQTIERMAELYNADGQELETGKRNMTAHYQRQSRTTYKHVPVSDDHELIYIVWGLTGEAGEVADKVKKIYRDKGGVFSEADIQALQAELGDVLWYLTQICTNLEISLDEVMQGNLDKLRDRLERGVIAGDGDDR